MLLDPLADGSAGFADVHLVAVVARDLVDYSSPSSWWDRILRVDELVPQGGGRTEHSTDAVVLDDSLQLSGDTIHEG